MSDEDDGQTHDAMSTISDRSSKTLSTISPNSQTLQDAFSIEQRTARIWQFGNLEALNLYQISRRDNEHALISSDHEDTAAERLDDSLTITTNGALHTNKTNELDMFEQNEESHGIFFTTDPTQTLGSQASECLSPSLINSPINTNINIDEFTTLAEHLDIIKCILTNSNIDLYFKHWHARWPLLHAPSQGSEDVPLGLQCSMALLGSMLKNGGHVSDEAKQLHDCLWNDLMQKIPLCMTGKSCLPLYQQAILNILLAMLIGETPLLRNAYLLLNTLVSTLRLNGSFSFANIVARYSDIAPSRKNWIQRGLVVQLIYSCFRLGCHLSLILDLPPLLRFEEINVPFPPTNAAWDAPDSDWVSALANEPPHRAHGPFNFLCSLAMSRLTAVDRLKLPGFFTPQDFELGMCGMQSRLWEETQCQNISAKLALAHTKYEIDEADEQASGYNQSWPVLMGIWRVTMEQFRQAGFHRSSPECEKEAYISGMTLHHAGLIRVYSDLPLIRQLVQGLCDGSSPAQAQYIRQLEVQVQQWARSHGVKEALWHAAQIVLLLDKEIQGTDSSEPSTISFVATECLFRAALAIWAYSRSNMICDLCGPAAAVPQDLHGRPYSTRDREQFELTTLSDNSKRYESWLRRGGRSSIEGVLVCSCNMPRLVNRCCDLLSKCAVIPGGCDRYVNVLKILVLHP
ncbi:hypothetical protein PV08_08362 [Exophiala spinifera]|uniref:Xylanolytic transcriptional activator regulatory domain-containing protein n=1 Tax=Exophiala spinifera TaxID=91928 RepID=A0A0D2B3F5_9EURO|nr:uncharacterized protein PV08_08362 [Exophiala spinifera]KIW13175.1 hypothetical protein PV08_08362 [Exophiala spinifera]